MNEEPLDPAVLSILGELTATPGVPAAQKSAEQLRQEMRDAIAVFTRGAAPIDVHEVTDGSAPGRGGDIPVRIYRPEAPTAVIVYLHGGAWMVGDIDTHDLVTRRISRDTDAVVVSVDYRMLPEHPFPAPFDDAWDAAVWASGLHPDLPFVVAGDSAGATLAACVALKARDEGGLRLDGQVLVYPGVDQDYDAPSMLAVADGPGNTRDDIAFYIELYAAHGAAAGSAYALPGRAESLAGLPPAIVAVAGYDALRSSNEDHARRLADAGVPVTLLLDHELTHSWIDFAPRVPSASAAFTRLTDSVNELVARAVVRV